MFGKQELISWKRKFQKMIQIDETNEEKEEITSFIHVDQSLRLFLNSQFPSVDRRLNFSIFISKSSYSIDC